MNSALITFLIYLATAITSYQEANDQIAAALQTGNAKEISKFFGSSVDLTTPEKEDVYSKAQAEMILKDFFAKHPPKAFSILHKGKSKLGIAYAIGKLETTKGTYRVTFQLKDAGAKKQIQQLKIDQDE